MIAPRWNRLTLLAAAATLVLGTVGQVHADILAYESFDYAANNQLRTNNGGTGFTGAWSQTGGGDGLVTAPGSTYPGLTTAGNKATLDASGGSANEFRTLDTSYGTVDGATTNPSTLYLSFLMQRTDATYPGRLLALSLINSGDPSGGTRLDIGGQNQHVGGVQNDSVGEYFVARGNAIGGGAAGTAFRSATTISDQTLALLVVRIDFNTDLTNPAATTANDAIRMYVNPTSDIEPGAADGQLNNFDLGSFDQIRLFAGGGSFAVGTFDEIRLGTSFADVSPASVPEPASGAILLLLVGGALLLPRGKRERQVA